ncbi:phosphate signaling complex PhoU family protein [Haloplanus natans]|uniref:phosphate signaling complex PhoU family protein n=1 Tax=Haloplanus natans TaxID=376171 RepID=UPI000677E69F|nr:phosphate uptake regulator PhoU [Haloplanus natans]
METRKLQKIGGSTYSVSLPKEWATEHRLEAGMPIHLYPHTDGSIVVRSAARDGGPLSSTTITLPAADGDVIERALRAAYAVGYDTISLVAPEGEELTADVRRAVRRCVRTMVGLSVTEETAERVAVENLLATSEVSIRQSVTQLQFTALSMHRTAIERVTRRVAGDSVESAPTLDDRDDEVDRLFEMLTRHFNRSLTDFEEVDDLDVNRSELFDYYLVGRQIERIADHAVRIGALADAVEPRSTRGRTASDDALAELTALAEATCEVVEMATAATLDACDDRAYEALERCDRVVDDVRALDRTLFERAPPGAYALSRVLASLIRTAECGGNVARVALRAGLRPE